MNTLKNIARKTLGAIPIILFLLAADLVQAAISPMGLSTPASGPAGWMTYTSPGTPGAESRLLLKRNGPDLELRDESSGTLLAAQGIDATLGVYIKGADGDHNDTLVIDLRGGMFVLPEGVRFEGGLGGYDALVLKGESADHLNLYMKNASDGKLAVDGLLIIFCGLEPVTITGPMASFGLSLLNGEATTVAIADGPPINGHQATTISGPLMESVTFTQVAAVAVNTGDGQTTVTVNIPNPAEGLSALTISGGSGSDEFHVTPASVPITINGAGPFPPVLPGDELHLVADGAADPLLTVVAGSGYYGTWSFSNRQNISFSGIDTLVPSCATSATVTNVNDSGAGSLRQAMASLCPGGTIDFNLAYPATITLTSGELAINKDMTIAGPGAASLTVSGNDASRVFNVAAGTTVAIQDIAIIKGYVSANYALGGGIYNGGTLTVTNCSISGNSASSTWLADGGGIYNGGTMTIQSSTFSGNSATAGVSASAGGGIANARTLTMTNCTISGNTARMGGGILNGGTLTVSNSTISGNSASYVGGGIANIGTLNYSNTIVANSPSGGDCYNDAGIYTNANNLVRDGSCSAALSGDPMLDPAGLQNNGGPTQTIALLAGSPAINAGAGCPADDQRGIARPQGAACDIGAYEFVPTTTTTVISSLNPSNYGDSVTFTATISDSEAASTPTGTVTFTDNGVDIAGCANVALSGTTATCSTSGLGAGSHTVNATYSGDTGFDGSNGTYAQTVIKADTITAVSSNNNPSFYPGPLTFTATVSSGATGTVTFIDGATILCAASPISVTTATCATSSLGAGSHSITATYSGDGNHNGSSGSVVQIVNKANTWTDIVLQSAPVSMVGQSFTVDFSVTYLMYGVVVPPVLSPTGNVTISDGVNSCTAAAGSWGSCTITLTTVGLRTLTATYTGDANFNGSASPGVSHTVNQASTTTSITSHTPDPSTIGQAVTVTYTVSVVSPGSGVPTGNVTVSDGINSCTGTVAAGSCVLSLTTPGAGTLTATYTGDANFIGSSSTASHTVLNQYLLNVTKTGSGTVTGSITGVEGNGINCGTDCSETYNQGAAVTLTVTPAAGWVFDAWSGSCTGSGACSVTMDALRSVAATFKEDTCRPITGIKAMAYEPITNAIPHLLFEETYPLGVGPYAVGKDRIWINAGMKGFTEATDLYFVLHMPSIEPGNYYLLQPNDTFNLLSEGMSPWKAGWSAAVDEGIFGIFSSRLLRSGTYELCLMATPAGRTDEYRLWETAFDIPFSGVMPLPAEDRWIVQQPSAFPVRSTDPAIANPIGLGSLAVNGKAMGLSAKASMGDRAELKIGLEGFDGPTDIYFGIYVPDIEPNDIFILRSDYMVQRLSAGLVAWKPGHTGPVEEVLGTVSLSSLVPCRYVIYLLATPQGRLDRWYLWESEITIP